MDGWPCLWWLTPGLALLIAACNMACLGTGATGHVHGVSYRYSYVSVCMVFAAFMCQSALLGGGGVLSPGVSPACQVGMVDPCGKLLPCGKGLHSVRGLRLANAVRALTQTCRSVCKAALPLLDRLATDQC